MEEIPKQLDQLLQDKSDNQRIYNWVEVLRSRSLSLPPSLCVCVLTTPLMSLSPLLFVVYQANLDEQQASSNAFVRALMTSICQAAIICESRNKFFSSFVAHFFFS